MKLNFKDIQQLDKYHRTNLITKISGLRTPFLIGSINEEGKSNLAIFNSIVHIGANPPCLGFIVRPLTVRRDTYDNIITGRHFTINQVHTDIVADAHLTSAKFPSEISEFDECGFTESYIDAFPAPYVAESQIKIGMSYLEEHHITINDTKMIIGQIEHIVLPDGSIDKQGNIDHEKLGTSVVAGLDHYHNVNGLCKLDYAKYTKKA